MSLQSPRFGISSLAGELFLSLSEPTTGAADAVQGSRSQCVYVVIFLHLVHGLKMQGALLVTPLWFGT
jgi:hypothetical protein